MSGYDEQQAIEYVMKALNYADTFGAGADAKMCPVDQMLRQLCEIRFDVDECKISEAGALMLAKRAISYRQAYDLAIKVCAWNLVRQKPVPKALREIAGHALYRYDPPKKLTGYVSGKNFHRNVMLFKCVKFLNEAPFFIKPTHNATRSERSTASKSGCELVALACNRIGQHMITADVVQNAWKDENIRSQIALLEL